MKYCILSIALFFSLTSVFSQRTDALRLSINPFVQKIGNLNSQYISKANEFIDLDYKKLPSQEIALDYSRSFEGKFAVGIGVSWMYSQYRNTIHLKHPNASNDFNVVSFSRLTEVQSVSVRFSASYQIMDRLHLNTYLSAYAPVSETSDSPSETNVTVFSSNLFYYDIHLNESGYFGFPKIIPEIGVSFRVYKNLNILTGIRFKFWENGTYNHYKVDVKGWVSPDHYGEFDSQLHLSAVDNRVFTYYLGISYDFSLNKK